jgi:predicted TIM-barrel fold metal-dependent hydrolase
MLIVDAQVHIWGADTPERPWPESGRNRAHRPEPFSKDDLLREMEAAGVARVVIVPPSWEGDRNDLALESARLHPDKFAAMGRPPLQPQAAHELDTWRDQPGMLGIRVTSAGDGSRAFFTEPDGDWLWAAAERNGLPAMVSPPGLLPEVDRLAERHPRMRVVIDHLALARHGKDEAAFGDLPTCWHWRNGRTSRSRHRPCRAIRASPTLTSDCTRTYGRCSTRSGRNACSGAPT